MAKPTTEVERQVEAAYDYRGHATISFKDGTKIEGFVFNREFANPRLAEDRFIEYYPKNSEERRRTKIDDIASVELTGQDHAETYEQGLKRAHHNGDIR